MASTTSTTIVPSPPNPPPLPLPLPPTGHSISSSKTPFHNSSTPILTFKTLKTSFGTHSNSNNLILLVSTPVTWPALPWPALTWPALPSFNVDFLLK